MIGDFWLLVRWCSPWSVFAVLTMGSLNLFHHSVLLDVHGPSEHTSDFKFVPFISEKMPFSFWMLHFICSLLSLFAFFTARHTVNNARGFSLQLRKRMLTRPEWWAENKTRVRAERKPIVLYRVMGLNVFFVGLFVRIYHHVFI